MNDYEDIINMERHTSTTHPRMSMHARAAQFASFSALTEKKDACDDDGANGTIGQPNAKQ